MVANAKAFPSAHHSNLKPGMSQHHAVARSAPYTWLELWARAPSCVAVGEKALARAKLLLNLHGSPPLQSSPSPQQRPTTLQRTGVRSEAQSCLSFGPTQLQLKTVMGKFLQEPHCLRIGTRVTTAIVVKPADAGVDYLSVLMHRHAGKTASKKSRLKSSESRSVSESAWEVTRTSAIQPTYAAMDPPLHTCIAKRENPLHKFTAHARRCPSRPPLQSETLVSHSNELLRAQRHQQLMRGGKGGREGGLIWFGLVWFGLGWTWRGLACFGLGGSGCGCGRGERRVVVVAAFWVGRGLSLPPWVNEKVPGEGQKGGLWGRPHAHTAPSPPTSATPSASRPTHTHLAWRKPGHQQRKTHIFGTPFSPSFPSRHPSSPLPRIILRKSLEACLEGREGGGGTSTDEYRLRTSKREKERE